MPKLVIRTPVQPDPRLARCLWQWLALGLLLVALVPAARGDSLLFGALPFWLVVAPLSSLLVVHRHALAAVWRGILVPAPRRRRPRPSGPQARRVGFGARGLRRQPQRAA